MGSITFKLGTELFISSTLSVGNSHCLVPEEYEVEGVRLGRWVGRQRQDYKNGRLSENCVKCLTEIEFE